MFLKSTKNLRSIARGTVTARSHKALQDLVLLLCGTDEVYIGSPGT